MYSQIQLKHKVFIGFLFVAIFTLIVGVTNYVYLGKVIGKFDHVVKINMTNLDRLSEMRDSARTVRSRIYFIMGQTKGHEQKVKEALERMAEEINRFERNEKAYLDVHFAPGEEERYKKVDDGWKVVKAKTQEIISLYKAEGSSEKVYQLFLNGFEHTSDELFHSLNELMDFQHNESQKWSNMSADIAGFSSIVSITLVVVGFIASLILGTVLSRMITSQLTSAITELNKSAPELIKAATDLGAMSSELSSCATEQAASVQETASSLEEISAMIRRNSDHTSNALQSSSESLASVQKGQQAVSNMMEAMKEINVNNNAFNDFMKKNNDELREMVNVITNISEKTKVINDIVFQTKLLSFNASVEAARAGEQGKGFAVVAEEVGNLAQMSGNAANEIKGLLEESIVKVNEIVGNTKSQVEKLVFDGKVKIDSGVGRAKDCDIALLEINENVSKVQSLVSEVSLASSEQSTGIAEVNKAMGQIDEVTNQNSVAAQKVADNASSVMQLSNSVKETSDKLRVLLLGKKSTQQVELGMPSANGSSNERPLQREERPRSVKMNAPVNRKKEMPELKLVNATPIEKTKVKALFESTEKDVITTPRNKAADSGLPAYDDKRFEDV
jgi:methyl-accepting chemotaxis protein